MDDVPRHLGTMKFLVRRKLPVVRWSIRLTWFDLAVVTGPPLLLWNFLSILGYATTPLPILGVPFEPFGLYALMVIPAVVISLLHRWYPQTDVSRILASLFAARLYRARRDRSWEPGEGRKVFALTGLREGDALGEAHELGRWR